MPNQTEPCSLLSSREFVARNGRRFNRDVPLDRHGDGLGTTHNRANLTAGSQPEHSTKTALCRSLTTWWAMQPILSVIGESASPKP